MPSKSTRLRRRKERRRQQNNEQARALRSEMAMRRRSSSTVTVEEPSEPKQVESSRKTVAKSRENPVDMVHEAAVKAKSMKPKAAEGTEQPAKHVVAKVSIVVMAILVLLGMVITGVF